MTSSWYISKYSYHDDVIIYLSQLSLILTFLIATSVWLQEIIMTVTEMFMSMAILTTDLSFTTLCNVGSSITHLPRSSCLWIFIYNIGSNMLPSDSLMLYVYSLQITLDKHWYTDDIFFSSLIVHIFINVCWECWASAVTAVIIHFARN